MQIHKKTHIVRCASETVKKLRFSDNLCSDYAEHESSESSHIETFPLKVRKPRYTPPVFMHLLRKYNIISCALPRVSVSIAKTDFIDRLKKSETIRFRSF